MDNLRQHCIPDGVFGPLAEHYETFLQERRRLMAEKARQYFSMLPVVNCDQAMLAYRRDCMTPYRRRRRGVIQSRR
jgi:hypothetical protein